MHMQNISHLAILWGHLQPLCQIVPLFCLPAEVLLHTWHPFLLFLVPVTTLSGSIYLVQSWSITFKPRFLADRRAASVLSFSYFTTAVCALLFVVRALALSCSALHVTCPLLTIHELEWHHWQCSEHAQWRQCNHVLLQRACSLCSTQTDGHKDMQMDTRLNALPLNDHMWGLLTRTPNYI